MTGDRGMAPSRQEAPLFDVVMVGQMVRPVQCRNGKGYAIIV